MMTLKPKSKYTAEGGCNEATNRAPKQTYHPEHAMTLFVLLAVLSIDAELLSQISEAIIRVIVALELCWAIY